MRREALRGQRMFTMLQARTYNKSQMSPALSLLSIGREIALALGSITFRESTCFNKQQMYKIHTIGK